MKEIFLYTKQKWWIVPSTTQMIETIIKECGLCCSTGRLKGSALLLAMLRSTTIHHMINRAQEEQVLIKLEKGKDTDMKKKNNEKVRGVVRVKHILDTTMKTRQKRGKRGKKEINEMIKLLTAKEEKYATKRVQKKVSSFQKNMTRDLDIGRAA